MAVVLAEFGSPVIRATEVPTVVKGVGAALILALVTALTAPLMIAPALAFAAVTSELASSGTTEDSAPT